MCAHTGTYPFIHLSISRRTSNLMKTMSDGAGTNPGYDK